MNTQLIQCGDHKWAPWSLVCVHLVNRESHEWCPVPNPDPEVDHDWLCPQCFEKYPDVDVEVVRCICIHCVRELRAGASDGEVSEEQVE
jgi:hypothetical protein